jgi:transcriptional regulator with XRE-family HTH domain
VDDLGSRIRTLRNEAGLTQTELAILASVSRRTVARIEAGLHQPNRSTLRLLTQALGAPDLANGDEGAAA